MDNGVLRSPVSRMPATPSVPPQKKDTGGIIMLLLACAVFIAVCAFAVFRGTDTGTTKNREADVQAKNWDPDGTFVQPTRRDARPPSNDRVAQTSTKPKPPAPKGFHDFHLGMTRKSVHELVESWGMPMDQIVCGDAIRKFPRRYGDVEKMEIRFDDSWGLWMDGRNYRRSAELPPGTVEARLKYITVNFESVEGALPPWEMLSPLRERFGPPEIEERGAEISQRLLRDNPPGPQYAHHVPLLQELYGSGFDRMFLDREAMWIWADTDRTVIAGVLKGRVTALRLFFADGLLAREAERMKNERKKIDSAVENIRKGIK